MDFDNPSIIYYIPVIAMDFHISGAQSAVSAGLFGQDGRLRVAATTTL